MHSQFFFTKVMLLKKANHFLSICICWIRIWHWNCKISSGF